MNKNGAAFIVFLVLGGGSAFAQSPASTATLASTFQYQIRHLRDPFVALSAAAGSLAGPEKPAKKTLQELEESFDPAGLSLQAMLGREKKGMEMAIIVLAGSSKDQAPDRYLVKGRRIQHIASGVVLKKFTASIRGNQVFIQRSDGGESPVGFPKKGQEGKSP